MRQFEVSVYNLIEKNINELVSSVQLFHNVTSNMFMSNKAKRKCKFRNSTKTHKNILETELDLAFPGQSENRTKFCEIRFSVNES